MEFILEGFAEGLRRALSGDPEVWGAAWVTLRVSFWATIAASLLGLPAGYFLATTRFRGRGSVLALLQSLLGLPTVVIGLLVYGFLSRRGPLGELGLLFSPPAIVIGLILLALPITTVYGMTSVGAVDARARETALTLGASNLLAAWAVFREARFGMVAAVLGAFGRVSSEVGVAMMLGGNIEGYTRTLTTAIALESMKGEFGFGVALGSVLMAIVIAVTVLSRFLQRS